jgi:hypothetical protein
MVGSQVLWVLSLFAPWCTESFVREGPATPKGVVYGFAWNTRSFPFLLITREAVCMDGARVIPQYVFSHMSPSMLAFLAMQNAYVHGRGIRINVG